eukprot:TRINITY_DN278_c0_g1_i17.p1 TRINITY_DN278_c0_g1~~TRINITY_DN278_c0_g1_i17.p1  ORF type:complete len:550 (+),score=140.85 TRINITY_DN278_c0_g1_i17:66-1715(+)
MVNYNITQFGVKLPQFKVVWVGEEDGSDADTYQEFLRRYKGEVVRVDGEGGMFAELEGGRVGWVVGGGDAATRAAQDNRFIQLGEPPLGDDDAGTKREEAPFIFSLDDHSCVFGNSCTDAREVPSSATRHAGAIEINRKCENNIFTEGRISSVMWVALPLNFIHRLLQSRLESTSLIVTEAPNGDNLSHERLARVIHTIIKRPTYYTCPEALTLLTHGQTSGIVVTIQSSYAKVVPILNGEPLVNCITIHDGFELPVGQKYVLLEAQAKSLLAAIHVREKVVPLSGKCITKGEFYSWLQPQHDDFPFVCDEHRWLECEKVFCQSMGRIVRRMGAFSTMTGPLLMTGLTEKIHECVRLLPKAVLMKVCKRVVLDGPGADIRGMCERVEEELFPDPPEEGGVWTIGGDPLEKGVSDGLVRQQQAGSRFYEVRDTVYNLEMFTAMQGGTVQSIAPLQPPIPPTFSSLPPDVVRTVLSFLGPLLIYTDGHRVTRGPLGQSARQAYLGGLVAVERTSREAIAEVSKLDSRRGVRVLMEVFEVRKDKKPVKCSIC